MKKIFNISKVALFISGLGIFGLVGCTKDDPQVTPNTIVDVLSNNGFGTLTNLAVQANL